MANKVVVQSVYDDFEENLAAADRLGADFYERRNDSEEAKQRYLDHAKARAGLVLLCDNLRLCDHRLANAYTVINDLLENCPEAHILYQSRIDAGNAFKSVLEEKADVPFRQRY